MTQVHGSIETAINETIEKVRSRLWRKSHSLNSVKTFDKAVRKFEKYLAKKQLVYGDTIKAPIECLDEFGGSLDKHCAPGTTRQYLYYTKKLLKAMGAKIDYDDFKENVVLPKSRTFMDDKVNEDQIRRIVLASKNERLKCLLMLMKDTGARPREILGLKLGDFNIAHDPPYLTIPPYLAKNDIPREVFFTPETKTLLMAYMQNRGMGNGNGFTFLSGLVDELDEERFQYKLEQIQAYMGYCFRQIMSKPQFADMNEEVRQQGSAKRYKIHIYSFKKFAFTRMADTLGEIAAHAITGHKAYLITYYKKSREERAEDYRRVMPKLSVFALDEKSTIRKQVEETIKTMKDEDVGRLLEFIANGKKLPKK